MKEKRKLINKICLNTLHDLMKENLSVCEKADVIKVLNKDYSYSQISVMTGVPKSTISTWVLRGKEFSTDKPKRRLDIVELIQYFEEMHPEIGEWGNLHKLRDVLSAVLEDKNGTK